MGKDVLELLEQMRTRAHERRTHPRVETLSFGARAADAVVAAVGSWRFILIQSTLLGGWLLFNALSGKPFDPFPFILLNLLLSFQAAYTAPVIMMSQNRQSEIDRQRGIEDFEINKKAELEIETLHHKLDLLREQELATLSAAVERLTRLLEEKR